MPVPLEKPEEPDALRDQLTNNQAAATLPGGLTAYLAYQNALAVNWRARPHRRR